MFNQTVKLMGRQLMQKSVRFSGSHGGVPGEVKIIDFPSLCNFNLKKDSENSLTDGNHIFGLDHSLPKRQFVKFLKRNLISRFSTPHVNLVNYNFAFVLFVHFSISVLDWFDASLSTLPYYMLATILPSLRVSRNNAIEIQERKDENCSDFSSCYCDCWFTFLHLH